MPLANNFVSDLTIAETLIIIILGWTLVPLWSRFIDNLAFNTLKLNSSSTYQTFIIALLTTIIFLLFLFSFDNLTGNLLENNISGLNPPIPIS